MTGRANDSRFTIFDHEGTAIEFGETRFKAARQVARKASKRVDVAYATVVGPERLDVYARGRNRLRIRRPSP